jgi:hypothetical protein
MWARRKIASASQQGLPRSKALAALAQDEEAKG